MAALRLGARLAGGLWVSPIGGLMASIFIVAVPLLRVLAPGGARADGPGAREVAGLVLLAALAWALVDLHRRRAILELLARSSRRAVELTVLVLVPLGGLALCVAGAGGPGPGGPAWLALAGITALHLAGIALPLAASAWAGHARAASFLALTWWGPALLLDAGGWQGWVRALLAPALALEPRPSDSPWTGAILPRALLAAAAILAGALTAHSTTRSA